MSGIKQKPRPVRRRRVANPLEIVFSVRLTRSEAAQVHLAAARAGLAPTTYLRLLLQPLLVEAAA